MRTKKLPTTFRAALKAAKDRGEIDEGTDVVVELDTARAKVGAKGQQAGSAEKLVISPPNIQEATARVRGTTPYVQHAFSQKAVDTMVHTQELGSQSRKGRKREPKNFTEVYEAAMHKSREGWHGIPASAFRNAMISACRTVGFKMTIAKLSVFVKADGFDARDGTPLVRITKGEPRRHLAPARNDNGSTDIRCRPMWVDGWEADVHLTWDADQFAAVDVMNLLARVGQQVGIGEGRPDSRKSAGLGWGLFEVVN
jgi:hypothetical protein